MRSSITGPKITSTPLVEAKVNNMNCFFSQISQVNSDEQNLSSNSLKNDHLMNCNFTYDAQSILIITKGGNQFYLPLDQQILRIFPMVQGILIQFQVKAESKLKQILYYQKNKKNQSSMDIEEPGQLKSQLEFCYATITRHPLNPIKLLGELSGSVVSSLSSSSQIQSWYKSKEKVIAPISNTPLIISYNSELHRNALHLMLVNSQELEEQKIKAYIPTHNYSLKNMMAPSSNSFYGSSETTSTHHEIVTYPIYQSNDYEAQITQVIAAKSTKIGQTYIYTIDAFNTIRIFEISNIGCHNKHSNLPNVVEYKKIEKIGITLGPSKLLSDNGFIMEPYHCYQDHRNIHNYMNVPIDLETVYENLQELSDSIVIAETRQDNLALVYYYRGQKIWEEILKQKIEQVFETDKNNQNRFRLKIDGNELQKISLTSAKDSITLKIIQPLIQDSFDILIIRNMQITLLQSNHFATFMNNFKAAINQTETIKKQMIINILIDMEKAKIPALNSLHQLLQEMKIYQMMGKEREKLGSLLIQLAIQLNYYSYIDYYLRNGIVINTKSRQKILANSKKFTSMDLLQEPTPFSIYQLLNKIITKSAQLPKFPIVCIYRHTGFIINFISLLINGDYNVLTESWNKSIYAHSHIHSHQHSYIMKNNYPLFSNKAFQLEYSSLIRDKNSPISPKSCTFSQLSFLYLIKNNQTPRKILQYSLSIRTIICHLVSITKQQLPPEIYKILPELGFTLLSREDLFKNLRLYTKMDVPVPFYLQKPSFNDHIKTLVQSSSNEEQYFYTSNTPQINKINHDLIFEEVSLILSSTSEIKIRIKDIESIPDHKWEVESQNILLKFANRKVSVMIGQGAFVIGTSRSFITDIIKIPKINLQGLMPNDIKVTLDLKDDKQNILYWPEFHAGMVAGLKLSRHVIPLSQDHLKTWIFYQKPDNPKRDHSGFLLSLGLLGYLKCFSPTDIYQYLKPNNEFTSVSILLGCSASNIGRSEESLSKTLILHIPVLLPPGVDLEIPINVQTSALIGIGLLHKGTCNRTMTEMTLSQIGKKPCTDKCLDRQGYSLAAGWALGMICLGVKGAKDSFRDLRLEERLIRFIEGGKIMDPPQSMMSTNFINDARCSSIKQGPNVNLHITAPAALLALSLMYLKSNNQELSQKITLPNSFSTLQSCNPNHVLLKTIAKNLIMWDSIQNKEDYLFQQIPELIRFIYESTLKQVHEQYYLIYNVSEIDYQTVTSIYIGIITGGIVSIGLKYAGTGDENALKIIKNHIERLKAMKIIKCQFGNDVSNKNCIDQYQLYSLLSVSVLAMGVVMGGSCDISCLNVVKSIKKKFQESKVYHYGFNMAMNIAVGFIFLGYGNFTFNRSNMSIASLLITIYPQFPNHPTDNKYHLQALRHFYVLGLQEKIFHAVDVDTNKVISIQTEMKMEIGNKVVKQINHTPVLLQESKKLLHIRIMDQNYFDVDFEFGHQINPDTNIKAIYVKRKVYRQVSKDMLNPENVLSTKNTRQAILVGLKDEPRYRMFLNNSNKSNKSIDFSYILGKKSNSQLNQTQLSAMKKQQDKIQQTYSNLYFQMLKDDRLQMLEIYMNIDRQLSQYIKPNNRENSTLINNILHHNIETILNFEKQNNSIIFRKFCAPYLQKLEHNILEGNNVKILEQYYSAPSKFLVSSLNRNILNSRTYQNLSMLRIPNVIPLEHIKRAVEKVKQKNKNAKTDMEALLYKSYRQCNFKLLSHMLENYWK